MKNLKLVLSLTLLLACLISHAQDSLQNGAIVSNNKALVFLNGSGSDDGSRIIRPGGNAFRFKYKTNSLIFDALDDWPIKILDSSGTTKIVFHPTGNSYFKSGKLGVGLSGPNELLHLYSLTENSAAKIVTDKSDGVSKVIMENDAQSWDVRTAADDHFYIVDGTSAGVPVPFKIQPGAPTNTLFMKSSGEVGIGTSAPGAKLEVNGDITSHARITTNSSATQQPSLYLRNNGSAQSGQQFGYIFSNMADGIILQGSTTGIDNNTATGHLTIRQSGLVGIGKTAPSYTLDVAGQARASGYYRLTDVGSGGAGIIADDGVGATIFSITRNTGNEIRFQGIGDITFFNNGSSGTERMRITDDGNVGIGSTSVPSGYKLAVNGKAIVEEVKVQLSGSWPDYVFKDDYNLPSLEEIEKFIQSEKHLPEIPSASEVEENGIALGEMNALLLKKIEELTLYTIQQESKINDQSKEIQNLKANNDQLKMDNEELKINNDLISANLEAYDLKLSALLRRIENLEDK